MGLPPRACRTAETSLVGAGPSRGRPGPLAQRILHAARDEMAVTLADVVYRRTELGDPPGPGAARRVRFAARIAADALGWDEERRRREEASVVRPGAA